MTNKNLFSRLAAAAGIAALLGGTVVTATGIAYGQDRGENYDDGGGAGNVVDSPTPTPTPEPTATTPGDQTPGANTDGTGDRPDDCSGTICTPPTTGGKDSSGQTVDLGDYCYLGIDVSAWQLRQDGSLFLKEVKVYRAGDDVDFSLDPNNAMPTQYLNNQNGWNVIQDATNNRQGVERIGTVKDVSIPSANALMTLLPEQAGTGYTYLAMQMQGLKNVSDGDCVRAVKQALITLQSTPAVAPVTPAATVTTTKPVAPRIVPGG